MMKRPKHPISSDKTKALFSLSSLLMAICLLSGCSKPDKIADYTALEAFDTMELPYSSPHRWRTFYHPFFKTQVVTFIDDIKWELCCLDPDTKRHFSFPLKKLREQTSSSSKRPLCYYIVDSLYAVINFFNSQDLFYKINRNGDIVYKYSLSDSRDNKDPKIRLYSKMIPLPIQSQKGVTSLLCSFTPRFENSGNFISDKGVREKKFSGGLYVLLELSDTTLTVKSIIGQFPKDQLVPFSYYYIDPDYCISSGNRIFGIFPSINLIGETHLTGKTTFIPLQSEALKRVDEYDPDKVMDYNYLCKYSCEMNTLLHILPDYSSSNFYIISTKSDKYENPDGTVNDAANSPWILFVMNDKTEVVREIHFPKEIFSKHYCFPSPDGLYILSNQLTRRNKDKHMVFVGFKI